MDVKRINDEIKSYYEFHEQINSYFTIGYNGKAENNKHKQTLYFIDNNWIKKWKDYSKYETIKNFIIKDNNFKYEGENYNKNHNLGDLKTGDAYNNFLATIVHKIEDFDCLVDENTYKLFKKYKDFKLKTWKAHIFKDKEIKEIFCRFYENIFVLLTKDRKRIILYSKLIVNNELTQITFQFPISNINKEKNILVKNKTKFLELLKKDKNDKDPEKIDYFYAFKHTFLKTKENREKLINVLNNKLKIATKIMEPFNFAKGVIMVTNNNLFKQDISKINNLDYLIRSLKNLDSHRLIGLQNIGATCYMNATLQCLVNIKELTNYLLNANNFSEILKNIKICELLGSYCQLLQKLCCDQYVINSYPPDDFKNILSIKNPLFEGIQANDSKDLIYFLLEDFNKELNNLNLKINKNLIQNSNDDWIDDSKQSNRELMFETFIKTYSSENNNIIPKLFFSLIENETICNGCNTRKYNYQIVFSLELSLEVIYNKIYGNQNMNIGKKTLDLLQCLPNYNETNYFTGENAMYCNICQKQQESIYHKRIHSLSPILIIILNRGKGNQFDCDVNFPDYLNFQQNVINPSINVSYKLIGVVTHFGTSDMGGHFIAYCKHRVLNEWYCYNDAAVSKLSDPKNEYKNGVPYILFYESEQGNQNILFDNVGNNNFQNIQNLNPNCNNNGFVLNNMNNMNFQNNINMMNNNIYNMNLNNNMNTNNNIQNNFMANSNINANNMFINNNFNNMNNNMNMMPNITNFNMNTNMNMNNIMNNNFNIQINNNNCNNINNNMNNNMINNINNNIINNINNNVINNMNNNNMNYNNNSNNIQFNNPNINGMNFPQINNMNNNYISMNNNMNGNLS